MTHQRISGCSTVKKVLMSETLKMKTLGVANKFSSIFQRRQEQCRRSWGCSCIP